ncbi:hypothetical protein ASE75_08720 [Sphingomonas sp. Leaf17]|uniref:DUF2336 domain-containing protein n=1 Tax=Sphingomonas sp. Leaf17 TaxID=1735683 RepID=UPI0006FDE549|nr:DUF2336 domain-containing protein [Sphingomonas sp. Leaf17]KQM65113.1 hypothetical protein ASE75_08720 [Sphingomonas sp. Leaf17]
MSVDPDSCGGADNGAGLNRRMAMADARDGARATAAIDDFFRDPVDRIDDRTRQALDTLFAGIVHAIEADLRDRAGRSAIRRGATRSVATLAGGDMVVARLRATPAVRHGAVMRMLLARVELDGLAARLVPVATTQDGVSLLARLVDCPDAAIAAAAVDLFTHEARRRDAEAGPRSDLPAELHHRLVWQVAAAVRAVNAVLPDRDRALAEAAWGCIAAHDEGDRVEAAAVRLAAAIDARPDELPALMLESLGDRRPALFVAVLARAAGMDFDQARGLVIDPAGDRLLCALRAIGIDRRAMAGIGVALAQADPRRDVDALADRIDAIMAMPVADCALALAPMSLDRDFRDAIRAIGLAA